VTRRLVVTIVATVLATLVVAGAITLLIARLQARRTTERELRVQAEALAAAVPDGEEPSGPLERLIDRRTTQAVRRALRVDGIEFVVLGPAGRLNGMLPDGVTAADLDADALHAGATITGANGSLVYAAAPAPRGRSTVVAVVTRQASPGLASAARWFAFAALGTVALGALVAVALGRRLARPVVEASEVAQRVAAGDLSARLPEPTAGAANESGDELAELARSINTMAAGLERSKEREQQFLLSISHDLRTPLTSIRGYAEAIADGATPDVRAAAEVIGRQSERLERLVSDLLDLARLDAHAFTLHPIDHDLRQAVVDAVEAHEPRAQRMGLALRVDAGSEPVVVTADPARVQQALGNLLENASRHASARVDVRISTVDGQALVTVDDDGPGIAAQDRSHVFDRLYASRGTGGSGLGLAIVRQLTEAMHGSVNVGDSPHGGARLEVRLPLRRPA
jgi:two-component system sensor histidine kinase BaeS